MTRETPQTRLPTLATPRLELRPPSLEDAPPLFALHVRCATPAAARFMLRPPPANVDEVRARIEQNAGSFSTARSAFMWLLRARDPVGAASDPVVGYVAFVRWDHDNHVSEIAYVVDPERWGTGLAVEAVASILSYGHAELGLHRAEAHIDPLNTASIRVAEKLGFLLEGTLRENVFTGGRYVDTAIYGRRMPGTRSP